MDFDWTMDIGTPMEIKEDVEYVFNNVTDLGVIREKFYELWGYTFIESILSHGNAFINLFNNRIIDRSISIEPISIRFEWHRDLIHTSWNPNEYFRSDEGYVLGQDISEFLNAVLEKSIAVS